MRHTLLAGAFFVSACGFGTMSSKVRHTQTMPDGGEREVFAERVGVGVVTQQELARPGREDIDGAQAGFVDRTDPDKFYALYGFFPPWYYFRYDPHYFRPYYSYSYGGPYGYGDVHTNRRGPYALDRDLGHDPEINVARGKAYGEPRRDREMTRRAPPSGGDRAREPGLRRVEPPRDEAPLPSGCVPARIADEMSKIRREIYDTPRRDARRRNELLRKAREWLTGAMRECRNQSGVMGSLEDFSRKLAGLEEEARRYEDEGGAR